MALHQLEIEGEAARAMVRAVWPQATSCYVEGSSAEVYDPVTGIVLGQAVSEEYAVELAWVMAARFAQSRTSSKDLS